MLTTFLNIAVFQGIVIGLVILKSPIFKSKANKYLAFALITLSILLLNLVFERINIYETIPSLEFIDDLNLELAFPVLLLMFIVHQVAHPLARSNRLSWLFVPFLFFSTLNTIANLDVMFNFYRLPNSVWLVIKILKLLEFLFALIFMPGILAYAFTFIKTSKNIEEKKWITQLWLIVFILMFSWAVTVIFNIFLDFNIELIMRILAVFATLMIHWTAYSGLYKFKLAKDRDKIKALISNHSSTIHGDIVALYTDKTMQEKREAPIDSDNIYFKQLEVLCQDQHIYRDNTLDRVKVAETLGISSGYVSQLVNTITGNNFSTYINGYRVEAVKRMILDPKFDNYSLLAIGLEAGFSSKTTFHNAFKKITGMTPNAYRKTIR